MLQVHVASCTSIQLHALVAFFPSYVPGTKKLSLAYLNMFSFLRSGILIGSMYGLHLGSTFLDQHMQMATEMQLK